MNQASQLGGRIVCGDDGCTTRRLYVRGPWIFCVLCVLLAMLAAAVQQANAEDAAQASTADTVDMQWGVKIPMRDGVNLNATVYKPHAQKDALPVIFTFTPYVGDSYTDRAMYFASHGYVYALVDVRGRGNSAGVFEPFVNEGRDGYDVTEWLAKQNYCNGKVTMWGGSYAGFDQWSALKEFPPHLGDHRSGGRGTPGTGFSVSIQHLRDVRHAVVELYQRQDREFKHLSGMALFGLTKSMELYKEHRAFEEYDKLVGNPSPIFQKWLEHPIPDAYYDAMVPNPEQYKKISVPILTITGHFDGDQPGAFTYYKRHMQYGTAEAIANHYLIIGPWDHAGTRTPKRELNGLKFAEASALDLNKLHTEWYDWTMKSGAKPAFLKKRVAYYVMGAEEWKYADSLETLANDKLTLYLASNNNATDVFHSGMLQAAKGGSMAADSWTYDPLRTEAGEADQADDAASLTSQRSAFNLFGEGAIYHSEGFPAATEISGFVKLTLWLTMDVPDTDLGVELWELLPDGSAAFLSNATMRVRYRESLRAENWWRRESRRSMCSTISSFSRGKSRRAADYA